MYSLVNAIVKPLIGGGKWQYADLGNQLLPDIYKTYARAYVILSNPFLTANVSLDLATIRSVAGSLPITLNDYLVQNANKTLPTTDRVPVLNTRYARYKDAFRAGYKVTPVHASANPDAELPAGAKTWLYLSRDSTDFSSFGQYMMASVNGFFHRVEANADGAWIIEGMKSNILSNANQLGLLNFQDIGKLTYLPITADMIYSPNGAEQLRYRTYVDLGQDISTKTLLLVIAGYLHVVDPKTFRKINDTTIEIDFNNYPMFERYHESRQFIDYTSLPFTRSDTNPTLVNVDSFLSDANIKALLTLPQSFCVLVDNADLYEERSYIPATKLPGLFINTEKPEWPLIVGSGKVADYHYTLEDGAYAISCLDSVYRNRQYQTTDTLALTNLDGSTVPDDAWFIGHASFLKIGTDI